MNTVKDVLKSIKNLNPYSKFIAKYGTVLIITLYTAAVVTYLIAGRGVDYYLMMKLSEELMECVNPCAAILGLGAILFQALYKPDAESEENR